VADEKNRIEKLYDLISRSLLVILAIVAGVGAIWRMFARDKGVLDSLDGTTLLYLGVAGALVLLKEVKSLAFGDYKLEFERVREIAKEAKTTAENAQSNALGVGKQISKEEVKSTIAREEILPGKIPDDPWKGQFEGESERNDRKLEAEVTRVTGTSDLFSVCLRVSSTLPKQNPLRGVVQFFLHPTFNNDRPIVTVGPSGVAELRLKAWGAFTVGALADEGRTKLELDLSKLENAPHEFRTR
jgi:hypothetical protein